MRIYHCEWFSKNHCSWFRATVFAESPEHARELIVNNPCPKLYIHAVPYSTSEENPKGCDSFRYAEVIGNFVDEIKTMDCPTIITDGDYE